MAFGEYPAQTPDRVGSVQGLAELRRIAPGRQWNLIEIDLTAAQAEAATLHVAQLIAPCHTVCACPEYPV